MRVNNQADWGASWKSCARKTHLTDVTHSMGVMQVTQKLAGTNRNSLPNTIVILIDASASHDSCATVISNAITCILCCLQAGPAGQLTQVWYEKLQVVARLALEQQVCIDLYAMSQAACA